MAIIDVTTYQTLTGSLSSSDDIAAATAWCADVSTLLENHLRPFRFEPVTLTDQIYDAPVDTVLELRVRPVRSVSSIYFRADANGVVANFTSDYLLTADGSEYMLDVDDDVANFSFKGWVLRTNRQWGGRWWRPPQRLGYRLEPQPKCLKVTYQAGFLSVPADVQGAAALLVQRAMQARRLGAQVTSASLNGRSYSTGSATAELLDDPIIRSRLKRYLSVFVG